MMKKGSCGIAAGRFISDSPLPADVEGPYVFCSNDPIDRIDRNGLKDEKVYDFPLYNKHREAMAGAASLANFIEFENPKKRSKIQDKLNDKIKNYDPRKKYGTFILFRDESDKDITPKGKRSRNSCAETWATSLPMPPRFIKLNKDHLQKVWDNWREKYGAGQGAARFRTYMFLLIIHETAHSVGLPPEKEGKERVVPSGWLGVPPSGLSPDQVINWFLDNNRPFNVNL